MKEFEIINYFQGVIGSLERLNNEISSENVTEYLKWKSEVISGYLQYLQLSIYTHWEKGNKDAIRKLANEFPEVFESNEFIYNYYQDIFKNSYKSRVLKDKIVGYTEIYNWNDLLSDLMFSTNNLRLKDLSEFYKVIKFNLSDMFKIPFLKTISDSIIECLVEMRPDEFIEVGCSIVKANEEDTLNDIKDKLVQNYNQVFQLIFEDLVNIRNSLAHNYVRKIGFDERSFNLMSKMIELLISVFKILNLNLNFIIAKKANKIVQLNDVSIVRSFKDEKVIFEFDKLKLPNNIDVRDVFVIQKSISNVVAMRLSVSGDRCEDTNNKNIFSRAYSAISSENISDIKLNRGDENKFCFYTLKR